MFPEGEPYYTPAEIAEYAKVSLSTIMSLIHKGTKAGGRTIRLRADRVSARCYRVPNGAWEEYLEELRCARGEARNERRGRIRSHRAATAWLEKELNPAS
jgi:excisionase family DNA binding protein